MSNILITIIKIVQQLYKGWLNAYFHYFDYRGCINRLGFWSFAIIHSLLLMIMYIIDDYFMFIYRIYIDQYYLDCHILFTLYFLLSFFPSICLCIRRLHDLNLRGWWLCFVFIPLPIPNLNFLFRVLFLVAASYPGREPNRFSDQTKK